MEKGKAGGGSGESKWQSGEYARGILQKTGKKVLSPELEKELRDMPRAELMQDFGIEPTQGLYYEIEGGLRAGMGTDEAYKAIFGDRYKTKEEEEQAPNSEVEQAIARAMEANKDRYGNTFSQETLVNLQKLAVEDPERFAAEMMELSHDQRREAAEKGYMGAQKEIASLLEGRSPDEFLELYAHDINKFRRDIRREEKKIVAIDRTNQLDQYKTDDARKYQEKQLEEMRAVLKEMERKYALVANLQKGSEGVVPVGLKDVEEVLDIPEDEEGERPKDLRLEMLDVNDPTYSTKAKLRRGEFERVTQFMMAAEAERLMAQLKNTEELEQQLKQEAQTDFEESPEDEEGSDDEIKKTAEEAGGSRKRIKRREARADDADEQEEQAERERERKYRSAMSKWAAESKPGRFNDPELPDEKKEKLISKLSNALKGRKPFRRTVRKATLGLVLALTLFGRGANVAGDLNGDGVVYAAEQDTNGTSNVESDIIGDSAAELAESLGMSGEDLFGGEIDYLQHDLLAEGTALFEGIADRESSFVTSSGMIMDMAKYNDERRHGNSFAASIVDLKDDKEALINALMQNNIELPYQLASTTAAMPELLRACGIDESVIANENVAERAQAIMDAMLADGGGDLQKKLAAGLNIAVRNESTNINVYQEYGLERTFYVKPFEAENVDKPGDIQVRTDVKQRKGDWQVQIDVAYASGAHEVIDLNLGCGGQVNMYAESYVVRKVFTDENNVEHENVGVITVVTTENEDGTTNIETVYTDLGTDPDKEPEGEEPDGEQPEGEQPSEEIQQKSGENEQRIVDNGGQTNPVDQTANVEGLAGEGIVAPSNGTAVPVENLTGNTTGTYAVTSESSATPSGENAQLTASGQVADANVSAGQQALDQQGQNDANAAEKLSDLSDDQINEYIESMLQQ